MFYKKRYKIEYFVEGICLLFAILFITSCAPYYITNDVADQLQPSVLYTAFNTQPLKLKYRSKCSHAPSVNIINIETINEYRLFEHYGGTLINPKELTNSIVSYMKDAFEKCGVQNNDNSSKIIEVAIDGAALKIQTFSNGAAIQLKINVPEIHYTEVYKTEDSTPKGFHTAMAYAIHVAIWQVIHDPVIQDYIQCNIDGKSHIMKKEEPSTFANTTTSQNRLNDNNIIVVSGTFGDNCGVLKGNRTEHLANACNGKPLCDYVIDGNLLGDPYWGCGKNYVAEWQCGKESKLYRTVVQPEAGFKKKITLTCP